jgi:hypothetical protein
MSKSTHEGHEGREGHEDRLTWLARLRRATICGWQRPTRPWAAVQFGLVGSQPTIDRGAAAGGRQVSLSFMPFMIFMPFMSACGQAPLASNLLIQTPDRIPE